MNIKFTAEVPSNIAFIKYWGKQNESLQWPANTSLSMTLNHARTVTTAAVTAASQDVITKDGRDLNPKDSSAQKAFNHLKFLRQHLGFSQFLSIETKNTFPGECGIASSASGLGALTLAAIAAWTTSESLDTLQLRGYSKDKLAHLARMGSGSACRSFFGGFVTWSPGESPLSQSVAQIAPSTFWPLADLIVIVSAEKKAVPSTEAHRSAWTSPLFRPRLASLAERLALTRSAIETKNLHQLGTAIETDALEMHAVMMTSEPPAKYMTIDSQEVITWLRSERAAGNFAAYFTMDAGPNVHVICEAHNAESYGKKIRERFPDFQLIADSVGSGPVLYKGTPS